MTIDANVHNAVPGLHALMPYLPPVWAEQFDQTVFGGPFDFDDPYPRGSDLAVRPETRSITTTPSLELTQQEALDDQAERAVLLCTYAVASLRNPDQAAVLASAVNDWQIAEWLEKDDRLRASLVVPSQVPSMAAAEIERVGDHPGFVQVALPARAHHPYGSRLFHPLWEAMSRHDLVAGIHLGGAPGNPPTPVGWPSFFIEEYVGAAGVFAAQITNIVVEGVFDRFPDARVTLIESGCSWVPSHLWRFDKEWKNLRLSIPWVRRPPSAYIRDHVRLTTSPWDVPADDTLATELFDQLGSAEMLLHSSGYPHRSVGNQDHLYGVLSEDVVAKIISENARNWYRGLGDPATKGEES